MIGTMNVMEFEGEDVGKTQLPGPAGVGGEEEVHQSGGEVDGQVHQEMTEEVSQSSS